MCLQGGNGIFDASKIFCGCLSRRMSQKEKELSRVVRGEDLGPQVIHLLGQDEAKGTGKLVGLGAAARTSLLSCDEGSPLGRRAPC